MSHGLTFNNNSDVVTLDSEFARLVIIHKGIYGPAGGDFPSVVTSQEPPLIFVRPSAGGFQWVSLKGSPGNWTGFINGASGGSVSNVTTSGTGDDGVAVVSYANGGLCSDIKETNITVNGNRWGRGISVVGGIRISINGLNVSNTAAAGLYIASEGNPFYTHSVWQVSVASGTITSANVGTAVQGAILVYAGNRGHGIDSVRIADVTIKSTPAKAGRDVAVLADGGAPISNISFTQIALVDSSVQPFVTNVPRQISTTSRWSRNQIPLEVK